MARRYYIFDSIKKVFQRYGFAPLETPTMENLSVLTGKYGDEGDQLLFKVLNSGDYLSKSTMEDYQSGSKTFSTKITEKGLRYDLTVPFARYVAMHRSDISFPFKRYQIQPVWRADRPQRGRYREFYQCDADVVGTDSLLCESEIVQMIRDVFDSLQLKDFEIKINNRKILTGITEVIGAKGLESQFCVAIDKLDKIGQEKVVEELSRNGFSQQSTELLQPIFELRGVIEEKIDFLESFFDHNETGKQGIREIKEIMSYLAVGDKKMSQVNLDITLARGLSYYTGTIFEVVPTSVKMGSLCGGGRYDDLTSVFGLKDVSGVGISFGVDRIYDVLEELNLYPVANEAELDVLIVNFGGDSVLYVLKLLTELRTSGLRSEIFPDAVKIKKQMNYANNRNAKFVVIAGEDEMNTQSYSLKNMITGEQNSYKIEELISKIKNTI